MYYHNTIKMLFPKFADLNHRNPKTNFENTWNKCIFPKLSEWILQRKKKTWWMRKYKTWPKLSSEQASSTIVLAIFFCFQDI